MREMFSDIDHPNPDALNGAARPPLVDISLVTYNHERFVAQAIESVLAQRTDFKYRLMIGDDCSTDNTQAIIRSYAEEYPDRIKIVFDSQHRGIRHKDRVGIKLSALSKAKYLALLDGDDYWTDPHKLQKQVDFLESHPECSICFHNVRSFNENGLEPPQNLCSANQIEISTLEDLLKENFIPACSVVFRNGLFQELPEWYYELHQGDYPLHVLNAHHGKIGYINEVMAAYRKHENSYWSAKGMVWCLQQEIKAYRTFETYLGSRYRNVLRRSIADRYLTLSQLYEVEGRLSKAKGCAIRCLFERLSNGRVPEGHLCLTLLRLYIPFVYARLRSVTLRLRSMYGRPVR